VAAEELFFNECNTGNGEIVCYGNSTGILKIHGIVPVIVVLTKADAMEIEAIGQLRDKGLTMKEARPQAGELVKQLLIQVKKQVEDQLAECKHCPKDCLVLSGGYQCI